MLTTIIAEAVSTAGVTGSFTLGVAGAGSAIGIGLIGARMVLTIALAEAIAIFGLIFAFQGR